MQINCYCCYSTAVVLSHRWLAVSNDIWPVKTRFQQLRAGTNPWNWPLKRNVCAWIGSIDEVANAWKINRTRATSTLSTQIKTVTHVDNRSIRRVMRSRRRSSKQATVNTSTGRHPVSYQAKVNSTLDNNKTKKRWHSSILVVAVYSDHALLLSGHSTDIYHTTINHYKYVIDVFMFHSHVTSVFLYFLRFMLYTVLSSSETDLSWHNIQYSPSSCSS